MLARSWSKPACSLHGPNGEIVLEYKNGQNSAEVFFERNNSSEMLLYKGDVQIYAGQLKGKS
jgi:hypothetical protein